MATPTTMRSENQDGQHRSDMTTNTITPAKTNQMQKEMIAVVVQPGLSKARATREQLGLLSATENYLQETFQIPFAVIASP